MYYARPELRSIRFTTDEGMSVDFFRWLARRKLKRYQSDMTEGLDEVGIEAFVVFK